MKYLLFLFGLIATSLATQPATETVCNKIGASLNGAAVVTLPDVNIPAYVSILGLITVKVSVNLDCTVIAALIDLAVELSYLESSPVGGVVSADIILRIAADVDLNLNAMVDIKLLGIVQIDLGACVIAMVDVNIDLNIRVTFNVGDAANCKIKEVTPACSKRGCNISSGSSSVNTVAGERGSQICEPCFTNVCNKVGEVCRRAIEP